MATVSPVGRWIALLTFPKPPDPIVSLMSYRCRSSSRSSFLLILEFKFVKIEKNRRKAKIEIGTIERRAGKDLQKEKMARVVIEMSHSFDDAYFMTHAKDDSY